MNRMNLTKWKPLHIDLAGAGVFVLLALIAYMVGVYPVIQRHQNFVIREAELAVQQDKARKLSVRIARVASQITQIKQELTDNDINLKPASQINSHLARMARLVNRCGLKLDQLQPGKSLNGPRYQTVPIYLVGTGNFSACAKLLRELQRNFPDTSVASFEVKGNPTKPKEPTTLRVDLLWYAVADMQLSKG